MRQTVAYVVLVCILGQPSAFAREAPAQVAGRAPSSTSTAGTITDGIALEARRLARSTASESVSLQTGSGRRSWIDRHPVVFGAAVGAGGGAFLAATMENELFCSGGDEDCFYHGNSRILVGAGMGAGVGALIGWIVGR